MPGTCVPEFTFTFGGSGQQFVLRAPISLPMKESVTEYAHRLISAHNIPCFAEGVLREALEQFVCVETRKLNDNIAESALEGVDSQNVDALVQKWRDVFSKEVLQYSEPVPVSNEVMFSEVYHALIHSPALETLLNLEQTYSIAVGQVVEHRDRDRVHMEKRQRSEMEEAIEKLGISYSDEQINQMAQRHFENTQMIESKWASELSNLQETQRREYREWVMNVHEDTQSTDSTPSYIQRVKGLSRQMGHDAWGADQDSPSQLVKREESFTVHLGAQLKTMHNLRIISADVLDFCRHRSSKGTSIVLQPQRIQTATSLFSNNLCGLVLNVDNRLNSYTGIKREFARVCEQSTDFHFPNIERQFELIEEAVVLGNEWRQQRHSVEETDQLSVRSTGSDRISLRSTTSSSSDKDERNTRMHTGDFYVTRHSNLSEVHVVFHLVTDDSVRSIQSDISSRHPVLLGYRNILKAAYRYDIKSLTLPLLLVHDMSEEMTISWCMKRAELVFKCVKGFMMEFATWSAQQSKTIQFLVPTGLSEDTFAAISGMLSTIFRMSNPVVYKS